MTHALSDTVKLMYEGAAFIFSEGERTMLLPLSLLDAHRFSAWWIKKHPTRALMTTVYTASIIPVDDDWFDFDKDGEAAAILPIILEDNVLDLVAWKPAEPEKYWRRCGKKYPGYLGWDQMDGKESKTPYEWLLNGCLGYCKLHV